MDVETADLIPGCILVEDVFSKTNRPIIVKKTVLTDELIRYLKLFLIKHVKVEKTLVDGTVFIKDEMLVQAKKEKAFLDLYLQSVKEYKKEFQSWQSGAPVNLIKMRSILLPLLEKFEENKKEIYTLHHLSNKEEYIYQHAIAVGLLSAFIAKKLDYNKSETIQVALAGMFSDSGMSKISPNVLNKLDSLTEEEFQEVKKHTGYSYRMIQEFSLLKDVTRLSVFQHHERLDGSGYPIGALTAKIHPFAKIIAIADTFHAMTSERLYRRKQSPFKVLEKLREDHFGKFDIAALNALSEGIVQFSIGSKILLSNGQIAEIMFINDKAPTRPLVRIDETNEMVDLTKNRHLSIEEIVHL